MPSSSPPCKGILTPDVVKFGYLRKVKTSKKRFFLLRQGSMYGPARLEYYLSQRKLSLGLGPRRCFYLSNCLNIERKMDIPRYPYALALFTHSECISLATDSPEELEQWLQALQEVFNSNSMSFQYCHFEQVWGVVVRGKGLGDITHGPYHLGLTSTSLVFFKVSSNGFSLEVPLMSIRKCGHSRLFFCLELGRSAETGAGELWMQTGGSSMARTMHEAILRAMKGSQQCHHQPVSFSRTSLHSLSTTSTAPLGNQQEDSSSSLASSVNSSPLPQISLTDYLPMDSTPSGSPSVNSDSYLQMTSLVTNSLPTSSYEYLPMGSSNNANLSLPRCSFLSQKPHSVSYLPEEGYLSMKPSTHNF